MSRCIIEILGECNYVYLSFSWSFDFNMVLVYCGLLPDDLLQNQHYNCSFDLSSLISLLINWRGIFVILDRNNYYEIW